MKAARVAPQAAGLQCRPQGLPYRLQGELEQFAQRGGNAVLLHFEIEHSSHHSRASPSKEHNLDSLAKSTPKSFTSVINNTRIVCFWVDWGGRPPPRGGGGGGGGGGCDPPTPPPPGGGGGGGGGGCSPQTPPASA